MAQSTTIVAFYEHADSIIAAVEADRLGLRYQEPSLS
jgi:hypothetical protein